MAEVLLLKRKPYGEDVKPATWSDLKWMGRPRQGDAIVVRENGYYRVEALGVGIHGWNRNAYCLVRAPNVTYDAAKYLMDSYSNGTDTVHETVYYTTDIDGETVSIWCIGADSRPADSTTTISCSFREVLHAG